MKSRKKKFNKYFTFERCIKSGVVAFAWNRYRENFQQQTRTKRVISSIQFSPLTHVTTTVLLQVETSIRRMFIGYGSKRRNTFEDAAMLRNSRSRESIRCAFLWRRYLERLKNITHVWRRNVARANMILKTVYAPLAFRKKKQIAKRIDSRRVLLSLNDWNAVYSYM